MRRKCLRAPRLTLTDRLVFALTSLFVRSSRLPKLSIVVAHSTLLRLHKALVERKYSKLFSNKNRKPGPKGASAELIKLIRPSQELLTTVKLQFQNFFLALPRSFNWKF